MIVGFRLERTDKVCPSPKTLILMKHPTGRTILFHQDLLQYGLRSSSGLRPPSPRFAGKREVWRLWRYINFILNTYGSDCAAASLRFFFCPS